MDKQTSSNKVHPSTIICPITTQIKPTAKLLRIHLLPIKGNGLQKKSDIMIDQLRAIDNNRFVKKMDSECNYHSRIEGVLEDCVGFVKFRQESIFKSQWGAR